MKTPSLPETIKPFDIVAAVKRALKKEPVNESTSNLDLLRDLYIIHAWAADFGHEPQSVSGEYYWTPGTSSGAFERYAATVKAAAACAAWNLRYTASAQTKGLIDFFGKFNVVNCISRLLFDKAVKSTAPEYKGVPITFKSVSYKFGGDIMKAVPTDYEFQFDIGSDHYTMSVSSDYKKLTLGGKVNKTINAEDFVSEFDALVAAHDNAEFIDLATI